MNNELYIDRSCFILFFLISVLVRKEQRSVLCTGNENQKGHFLTKKLCEMTFVHLNIVKTAGVVLVNIWADDSGSKDVQNCRGAVLVNV